MSEKPGVRCPHCGITSDARQLLPKRLRRNQYGIDVFACPSCSAAIKIDPREYLFVSEEISAGRVTPGTSIEAAGENDLLPSEKMALEDSRRGGRGGCLPAIAVIGLGVGVLLDMNLL